MIREIGKHKSKFRENLAAAAVCDMDHLFYISYRVHLPELAQDKKFLGGSARSKAHDFTSTHWRCRPADTGLWQRREARTELLARQLQAVEPSLSLVKFKLV